MRSPLGEPKEYTLKPGRNTIGRSSDNDIPVPDVSASRLHAEVYLDREKNTISIQDMNSLNGTFVNRERLSQTKQLNADDVIRIGEHVLTLSFRDEAPQPKAKPTMGTQHLTRDLVLESLDQQAVLLYEVASRLNTVLDLDTALAEVSNLMKVSMGVDRCEVILSERFGQLAELGFPTSIARQAIEQRSAVIIHDAQSDPTIGRSAPLLRIRTAMCVPVISEEEIVALIYVYKTRPSARSFDQRDLQLAVAISHQTALTIQRMRLLQSVKRIQFVAQLLQRFLSPQEAKYILQDYLQTGQLPKLEEHILTVLVADIRDSTGMAERLGAWRFGEILGRYYQDMSDIVFKHGGIVNKFLGDGLMAVFGMTQEKTGAEEQAVNVALELLDQLEAINRDEAEHIEVGIGVNTGPAVAGYLGSEEHVEFTVLGDSVNVAWGLEGFARPNRILIGPATYHAIKDKYKTASFGPVEIKRRTKPIGAYEVLRK
jgi:adenylate cyclase